MTRLIGGGALSESRRQLGVPIEPGETPQSLRNCSGSPSLHAARGG